MGLDFKKILKRAETKTQEHLEQRKQTKAIQKEQAAQTAINRGKKIQDFSVKFLGGHPEVKMGFGKITFYENEIEFKAPMSKSSIIIPASELVEATIEGKEDVSRRITATRMITVGIFALAAPKKSVQREQYLTLSVANGMELIFEHENRFINEAMFKGMIGTTLSKMNRRLKVSAVTSQQAPATDPTAELEKYSDLFKKGVITQEEFTAKKKQLLGL